MYRQECMLTRSRRSTATTIYPSSQMLCCSLAFLLDPNACLKFLTSPNLHNPLQPSSAPVSYQ